MSVEDMDCKEIGELLTAYLDGEVTPEEKADIEAHLADCPECRAGLEALSTTRASLRRAFKVMADEAYPPDQAWQKVHARLETKGGRSWFWSSFTLGRVVATSAVVVILAIALVVWQSGYFGQEGAPAPMPATAPAPRPAPAPSMAPAPAPAPAPMPAPAAAPAPMPAPAPPAPVINIPPPPPPLKIISVPEEVYCLPGQRVEIEIVYVNVSSEPVTLLAFPPEINVNPPGTMKTVRSFEAGTGELKLGPAEGVRRNFEWDQRDDNGRQVTPGWYVVNVNVVYSHGEPPKTTRQGFGETAKILIRYPQGAMEKTIELNRSLTVNDITITLERIELSAEGARFYAFVVPPGYTPSQPVPMVMVPVHASYSFGGITRDAGLAGWGTRDDGIELIWGPPDQPLDPVPRDTKELIFTITRFGDIEGPWVFRIPLE